MKGCLPTATSTYLAVELVSDPAFVRILKLQHCTRNVGEKLKLREKLSLLLGI